MSKLAIDYISDLHIDHYISPNADKEEFFERFFNIQSIIFPVQYNTGKVLVLAGDISHFIYQIKWVIEFYSEMYEYVLYVHGNHEMYSLQGESTYKEKLIDLKNILIDVKNCYYLDGDIIEIDGIKIGGLPMWYDFSYGIKDFGKTELEMYNLWKGYMYDSKKIKDGFTKDYFIYPDGKIVEVTFDPRIYFKEQYNKLLTMKDCSLIVSHVMPFIPNDYPAKFKNETSGFFSFDSEEFILKSKVRHWIAGHTHSKIQTKRFGVRLYTNPYGYPNENWDKQMRQIVIEGKI